MFIMPDLADFLGSVSCYLGSTIMKGYGNPQENALVQFVSAVVGKNVEANVPQINEQLMKLKLPVPSGNVVVGLTRGVYSAYKGKNAKNVGIETLRGTLDQWLGEKAVGFSSGSSYTVVHNKNIAGYDLGVVHGTFAEMLAQAKAKGAVAMVVTADGGSAYTKSTTVHQIDAPGINLYIFK